MTSPRTIFTINALLAIRFTATIKLWVCRMCGTNLFSCLVCHVSMAGYIFTTFSRSAFSKDDSFEVQTVICVNGEKQWKGCTLLGFTSSTCQVSGFGFPLHLLLTSTRKLLIPWQVEDSMVSWELSVRQFMDQSSECWAKVHHQAGSFHISLGLYLLRRRSIAEDPVGGLWYGFGDSTVDS